MSHYMVAVIYNPDTQSVDGLLAPYEEDLDVEFKAVDVDEAIDEYKKHLAGANDDTYEDEDSFMSDRGYVRHDGEWGYWYNPDAKWDWYDDMGGRFSYCLWSDELEDYCNECALDDWDPDHVDKATYDDAVEQWNVWEENGFNGTLYKPEYLKSYYVDADGYASMRARNYPYAVVTPDGAWHASGEMGWWGCSSETGYEMRDFNSKIKSELRDPYLRSGYVVRTVDCHI